MGSRKAPQNAESRKAGPAPSPAPRGTSPRTFPPAAAAAAAIVLVVLAAVLLPPRLRRPVLGLYGLPASSAAAYRLIAEDAARPGGPFRAVELDASVPPEAHLRGRLPFLPPAVDLLVAEDGAALRAASPLLAPLGDDSASRLPRSLRALGRDSGGIRRALPLQADPFVLACRRAPLAAAGLEPPGSLQALTAAARRLRDGGKPSVVLAGSHDPAAVLSSFAAAAGGEREARALLDSWVAEGLLHAEWLHMGRADADALMLGAAPFFAYPLSLHRVLDFNAVSRYELARFPFPADSILARVECAAVPLSAPRGRKAFALLEYLASDEGQERLTESSGLAPASSSAEALDREADDARLWVAAAEAVLPDAARLAAATGRARLELEEEMKALYLERR